MPLIINDKRTEGSPKFCIKCGGALKLGEFAYKQTMCWGCFEAICTMIAASAHTSEERHMALYLLDVTREAHGIRR